MTSTVWETVTPPSQLARETVEKIQTHHRRTNAAKAQLLEHIGIFDANSFCMSYGAVTTASWLARELNYADATAYEYVRVARKLRKHPALAAALCTGQIDYTTVRLLIRYITEENETELIHLATMLCHAELKQALAGTPKNKDTGGTDDGPNPDPNDDPGPAETYIKTRTRDDGMLEGSFRLPPVTGQKLLAALKTAELSAHGIAKTGELAEPEEQLNDGEPQPPSHLDDVCDAPDVEETLPAQMLTPPPSDSPMSEDNILGTPSRYGPPLKDRMYDAFVTMIDMVCAQAPSPLRAPGAHVNIICTEDGKVWMPQNPQTPSRVIESYIANAIARGHLLDSRGLTLYVGRKQRLATDGQVTALLAVWGNQCAMPGCTHSRFIEIHHIHEWQDGGRTDIDNLIPLCSSCHSKVSHGLAHIEIRGGEIEFSFIDGSRYVTENRVLPKRTTDFEGPLLGYRDTNDLTFG